MSELKLQVSIFSETKLKISPDRGVAAMDEEPTIRWVPSGNLEIQYIGFADPVGDGCAIGIPHEDTSNNKGEWIATNANTTKELFSYTVYAKVSDGTGKSKVISSDPQIENEGKSGGAGWTG